MDENKFKRLRTLKIYNLGEIMIKQQLNNDIFTIILLNKESEEDDEEKWSFSYYYYRFEIIESETENMVKIYNNLGALVKLFTNVLLKF